MKFVKQMVVECPECKTIHTVLLTQEDVDDGVGQDGKVYCYSCLSKRCDEHLSELYKLLGKKPH